jgi:hypothetical protein
VRVFCRRREMRPHPCPVPKYRERERRAKPAGGAGWRNRFGIARLADRVTTAPRTRLAALVRPDALGRIPRQVRIRAGDETVTVRGFACRRLCARATCPSRGRRRRRGLLSELSNTADPSGDERTFRITHPFHPLCGREFALIERRENWGEDRVYYHDDGGRVAALPARWTSVFPPDPVVALSAGRSAFRVRRDREQGPAR